MTHPPHQDDPATGFGGPDPTRDIRLPPLPDRSPPVLPREWASGQRPPASPEPVATGPVSPEPTSPVADEPTDELAPPRGRHRERTIAFASPEMAGGRPTPVIGPAPRSRRWPWVLLALVPILVIVGAGIALLVLLRG
jgi:hypothetical protein